MRPLCFADDSDAVRCRSRILTEISGTLQWCPAEAISMIRPECQRKASAQITSGDDLAAAQSRSAAMARAKTSLKDVIERTLADPAGDRASGVVPNLKDGRAAASVLIVKGKDFKIVSQPLE
jgi:hypothetical protein